MSVVLVLNLEVFVCCLIAWVVPFLFVLGVVHLYMQYSLFNIFLPRKLINSSGVSSSLVKPSVLRGLMPA
jgi:hypothetical protein